jgi:hypothetical protein
MPATYDPIATQTVGSAVSSVTFSSIPSTYTDLVLVTSSTNDSGTSPSGVVFQLNGDTGSNYSTTVLYADGSTANSNRTTNDVYIYATWLGGGTSGTIVTGISHFMNYANTTTNKSVLIRYSNSSAEVDASVSLWRNTAAINSISIFSGTRQYKTGSTFTLYGIKAA